jgi:hypothetical protein
MADAELELSIQWEKILLLGSQEAIVGPEITALRRGIWSSARKVCSDRD